MNPTNTASDHLGRRSRRIGAIAAAIVVLIVSAGTIVWLMSRNAPESDQSGTARNASATPDADGDLRLYRNALALGQAYLSAHDHRLALDGLEPAPESMRGWEWRHLMRRADPSRVRLGSVIGHSMTVAAAGDPVDRVAAAGSFDSRIWSRDAAGRWSEDPPLPKGFEPVAFSADGRLLTSWFGVIRLADRAELPFAVCDDCGPVAFLEQDSLVLVRHAHNLTWIHRPESPGGDRDVRPAMWILRPESPADARQVLLPSVMVSVRVDASGRWAVGWDQEQRRAVAFDMASGAVIWTRPRGLLAVATELPLALTYEDDELWLLDLQDGSLVRRVPIVLPLRSADETWLEEWLLSPDARVLYWGHGGRDITMYDTRTGVALATVPGGRATICAGELVTLGRDNVVRIHDAVLAPQPYVLRPIGWSASHGSVAPDGGAVTANGGQLRAHDAETGIELWTLAATTTPIAALRHSPCGTMVAIGADGGELSVAMLEERRVVAHRPPNSDASAIVEVAWLIDGDRRTIVTLDDAGTMAAFDAATLDAIDASDLGADRVLALAALDEGAGVAAVVGDPGTDTPHRLMRIAAGPNAAVGALRLDRDEPLPAFDGGPRSFVVSTDGILVAVATDDSVVLLERVDGTWRAHAPIDASAVSLAFSIDGTRLAIVDRSDRLWIIAPPNVEPLVTYHVGVAPTSLAFVPDGRGDERLVGAGGDIAYVSFDTGTVDDRRRITTLIVREVIGNVNGDWIADEAARALQELPGLDESEVALGERLIEALSGGGDGEW